MTVKLSGGPYENLYASVAQRTHHLFKRRMCLGACFSGRGAVLPMFSGPVMSTQRSPLVDQPGVEVRGRLSGGSRYTLLSK